MSDFLLNLFLNFATLFIFVFTLILLSSLLAYLFVTRVPFVPTNKRIINQILEEFPMKKSAKIYDLGCGDGRFLFAAEKKYQTKGFGFELDFLAYLIFQCKKITKRSNNKIYLKNFFQHSIADSDLIYCYLHPKLMSAIYQKFIDESPKGSYLISNTFAVKTANPTKIIQSQKTKIYFYQNV